MKKMLISFMMILIAGCTTVETGEKPLVEKEDDPAQSYYDLGVKYIQLQKYDLAEARLRHSLSIEEKPETLNALALLYEQIHDNLSAEKTYKEMIDQFPDYLLGYSNYNVFLCKYDRAEQLNQLASKMASGSKDMAAMGAISAGDCAITKNKPEEAETFYKKALTYEPYSAGALLPLARIDLDRGFVNEAKQKVDLVNNQIGYTSESLYLSAVIASELGHSVDQRKYMRELVSRFPNSKEAKSLMGQ